MKTAFKRVIAVLLATAMVTAIGCRGPRNNYDEVAVEVADRIDVAKGYLTQQRYFDATNEFRSVLDELDEYNSEARLGLVISELLQFVSIIRVVSQLTGFEEESADENEFIISLVRDLVGDLTDRFTNIQYELTRLKTDPYVRLVLDDTPIYLTASDDPTLNLQGEWDRSEVFLLDAPVQAILGILKLVDSIDLRGDYLGLYNRVVDMDLDFGGAPEDDLDGDPDDSDIEESILNAVGAIEFVFPQIQNLLAWTLIKNPDFLGVRPDGGVELRQESGEHLVNAIDSFQRALFFTSLDARYDLDQTDDIIAWGIGKEYQSYDVPEPIDPDLDACEVRGTDDSDMADYSFVMRFDPEEPSEFSTGADTSCLISKIKDSLDGTGVRINLIDDILPVVISLISSVADLGNSTLIESTVTTIVTQYVGNSLEFDFGPLFAAPKGFRTFMPAYDRPEDIGDNEDSWMLMLESECVWDATTDRYADAVTAYREELAKDGNEDLYYRQRVVSRILCWEEADAERNYAADVTGYCDETNDDNICDTGHFTPNKVNDVTPGDPDDDVPSADDLSGEAYGISRLPADGIHSILPYIAFQDASFNGLLWVDVNNVASDDNNLAELDPSPSFEPATNTSLNALLAFVGSNVQEILDLVKAL